MTGNSRIVRVVIRLVERTKFVPLLGSKVTSSVTITRVKYLLV